MVLKRIFGILDIATDIGPYKGAVMYATTEFISPAKQKVVPRMGTPNAWKIWLNGELFLPARNISGGCNSISTGSRSSSKQARIRFCSLLQNEQEEDWLKSTSSSFVFPMRLKRRSSGRSIIQFEIASLLPRMILHLKSTNDFKLI
ncbi:MAG: hypothetical protein R3C11_06790 [Planctomycetaceae bacterium]